MLWPFDTKFVCVTDIKMLLGIATQMSVSKVKVIISQNRISAVINNLSLPCRMDAEFCIWVACIKRQFDIASEMSLIMVRVTVAVIEIQLSRYNVCLL